MKDNYTTDFHFLLKTFQACITTCNVWNLFPAYIILVIKMYNHQGKEGAFYSASRYTQLYSLIQSNNHNITNKSWLLN